MVKNLKKKILNVGLGEQPLETVILDYFSSLTLCSTKFHCIHR